MKDIQRTEFIKSLCESSNLAAREFPAKPNDSRQGFASACTAALTQAAFKLAPRVFLMVLEHNTPALAAYKRLGFRSIERMYLTRFLL
jgi:hypothetical protein